MVGNQSILMCLSVCLSVCVCLCVCMCVSISPELTSNFRQFLLHLRQEYCDNRICLCVCLFVCPPRYLRKCTTDLQQFSYARYRWPWLGSVLIRWRCDTLCTSGFMDDVSFSYTANTARMSVLWTTIGLLSARQRTRTGDADRAPIR